VPTNVYYHKNKLMTRKLKI